MWGDVFKQTHAGQTPQQYNLQFQAAAASPPPTPPVQPFLTPQDLQEVANFNFGNAINMADIDRALTDLQTQTSYQKQQNDTEAKQVSNQTSDQMAGRGLFRSSIKDAALYDIQAQNTLRQKFLDDQLTTAVLDAQTRKDAIAAAQRAFQSAMDARAAANAKSINDTIPAPVSAPAAPTPYVAPTQPKPAPSSGSFGTTQKKTNTSTTPGWAAGSSWSQQNRWG